MFFRAIFRSDRKAFLKKSLCRSYKLIATNKELGAADEDALAILEAAKVNGKDLIPIEIAQYKKVHNIDSFPVGSAMALNTYGLEPKITLVIAANGPKGPFNPQNPYPQKLELFSAIYNSLLKANEYGAKSVSISATSAGTDGVPLGIANELYFKAALLFFINETTSIEHIRFVSSKNEVEHHGVQKMAEQFLELFP